MCACGQLRSDSCGGVCVEASGISRAVAPGGATALPASCPAVSPPFASAPCASAPCAPAQTLPGAVSCPYCPDSARPEFRLNAFVMPPPPCIGSESCWPGSPRHPMLLFSDTGVLRGGCGGDGLWKLGDRCGGGCCTALAAVVWCPLSLPLVPLARTHRLQVEVLPS